MSPVASFTIPASAFDLGRLVGAELETYTELYPVVPAGEGAASYIKVYADPERLETLEERLRNEPQVRGFNVVATGDYSRLYEIEWSPTTGELFECLADYDIGIVRAGGDSDTWRFRILTPEHAALKSFQQRCMDAGIALEIERVSETVPPDDDTAAALTAPQREALQLARKRGYYEIPRETTLEELSCELGITRQAVSDRLRRGTKTLVDRALGDPRTDAQR